jgi:hypothetical protein
MAVRRCSDAEQEKLRLEDEYRAAAGTPSERTATVKLRAAELRVALCRRTLHVVRQISAHGRIEA